MKFQDWSKADPMKSDLKPLLAVLGVLAVIVLATIVAGLLL